MMLCGCYLSLRQHYIQRIESIVVQTQQRSYLINVSARFIKISEINGNMREIFKRGNNIFPAVDLACQVKGLTIGPGGVLQIADSAMDVPCIRDPVDFRTNISQNHCLFLSFLKQFQGLLGVSEFEICPAEIAR